MVSEQRPSKISRRSVLVRVVGLVVLLAYCASLLVSFGRAYTEAREPANVFEEMYWSSIDGNAWAAVSGEGGPLFPGKYLPAALNPFKENQVERAGFEWAPRRQHAGHIPYAGFDIRDGDDSPYCVGWRFDGHYGNWICPMNKEYELASGEKVYVKGMELHDVGTKNLTYDCDCYIGFYITTDEYASMGYSRLANDDEPGIDLESCVATIWVSYDSTEKSVSRRIKFGEGYDGEELRAVAEDALASVFEEYLLAAGSRFSKDDLGILNWSDWSVKEYASSRGFSKRIWSTPYI